ncbi:hypothetical protein [Methylobacterium sp. WL6]|uniref:hypothetical protein n=1 Tax=Methylobacterium sp. WL6 TaxID=2603901 RepID=UPI0016509692|nr:hypothetical protein [Methylobacterium sp. WL6]
MTIPTFIAASSTPIELAIKMMIVIYYGPVMSSMARAPRFGESGSERAVRLFDPEVW